MTWLATLKGRIAMIGLALALAVIAGLMFRSAHLAEKLEQTEQREAVALAANASNLVTISALQAAAERDSTLLRNLGSDLAEIALAASARSDERARIARNDESVSDFLSQPIPCGLRDDPDGDADCPGSD